jgi:hypothetical protein
MDVTEYEGSDRVRFTCNDCGYERWITKPTLDQLIDIRCHCTDGETSFLEYKYVHTT